MIAPRQLLKSMTAGPNKWKWTAAVFAVVAIVVLLVIYSRRPAEEAAANRDYVSGDIAQSTTTSATAGVIASPSSMLAAYKNNPTETLGQELAQALFAAGDYEELLKHLAADPPILAEPVANALYRAEALVNLHRYDEAFELASALIRDGVETHYASLVIAKSQYGLGSFDASRKALLTALKAGPEIAGQAWMFRARIALDANAIDEALKAIERARETGVPQTMLQAVQIEAALRSGDLAGARKSLAPRLAATRADEQTIDVEAIRLAAMERAIAGDAVMAAREIDSVARWVDHQLRGPLLRAALKMLAGDRSQAENLVRNYLIYAPEDWVALDLLLDIRMTDAPPKEAEAMIARLTAANPLRGNLRRYAYQRAKGSPGQAAQAFRDAASMIEGEKARQQKTPSALSFLLGTALASGDGPLSPADYALAPDLARFFDGAPGEAMNQARALASASNDPVRLILAGDIALVGGDLETAARAFERGGSFRTGDFAFVDRQVRVALRRNDLVSARTLVDVFIIEHPDAINARLTASRIALHQASAAAAQRYFSQTPPAVLFASDDAVLHLAAIYNELGDAAALDALCHESKKHIAGTLTQARLYQLAGDEAAAILAYRSALMSAPDDVVAVREYARLMVSADRAGDAMTFLNRLLRKNSPPRDGEKDAKKTAETEEILAGLRRQAEGDDVEAGQSPPPVLLALSDREARKAAFAVYARQPQNASALFYYGNLLTPGPASNRSGLLLEACIFGAKGACATLKGDKPGG